MAQTYKIIGISGGSGAGKTTLANALLQRYKGESILISYDRYYKRMECGNYDIPEALDTELLLEHLRSLKSGQAVDLPIYDRFKNQRTSAVERVEPKPIIIVEGIFALHHPELLDIYHCKVYVETSTDSVRFHRRLIRDIRERGDTEASIAKAWVENVLPMHGLWVGSQPPSALLPPPHPPSTRLRQPIRTDAESVNCAGAKRYHSSIGIIPLNE
jgi:uridine kinase